MSHVKDVLLDLDPPRLQIHKAKFHKSRLVPIHQTVADQLRQYIELRRRLNYDGLSDSFFVSEQGGRLSYRALNHTFQRFGKGLKRNRQRMKYQMSSVSRKEIDILQRFYDESFAAFSDAQREAVREYVEDRMVTVAGHRNPVAREDAVAELARQGVSEPDNALNALIARRLLTTE